MSGYGGAVAARHAGDEYQARYFWTEALRMLGRRTDVRSVAFEHGDSGKFDDVVVHYRPTHRRSALNVAREGVQLKYHVSGTDSVKWQSFTDRTFLGRRSTTTVVEALTSAYRQHPEALFTIVTTWHLDGSDTLCAALRGDDRRLDVDRLFAAKRSELAKQRRAMLELSGGDEHLLRNALERVVLWPGIGLIDITRILDGHLTGLGLEPVGDRLASPYDSIPFASLRHGEVNWDVEHLREVLAQQFGWSPPRDSDNRHRVAVRQFMQFAENLDDDVDAFLDLVDRFTNRRPAAGQEWTGTIEPTIREFVRAEVETHREVELRLATSLSVSYAIGAAIREKAPAHVFVSQQTMGQTSLWDTAAQSSSDAEWIEQTIELDEAVADVAVVVSMTHNALDDAVSWSRRVGLPLSRVTGFRLAHPGQAAIRDSGHCVALAQRLAAELRALAHGRRLHLFLSGPAAFAVLLGRLARGLGRVQLYEFDFERRHIEKSYFPSILIEAGSD